MPNDPTASPLEAMTAARATTGASSRPSDGAAEEDPFLSLVVPALDEERRLPSTLTCLLNYLGRQSYAWELLVVDDGSGDRTAEVARRTLSIPGGRVIRHDHNLGKGAAVRTGMLAARGAYRLFSDADLSTPIEELDKLMAAVEGGPFDVAIGSRALAESRVEVHQSALRETMGRIFNWIVRSLAVSGIRDTQCGFKLFTAPAAREIFSRLESSGWAFDVEVLMIARERGLRVAEVPVRWINSPDTRISLLRDSAHMLLDLLKLRWRRLCAWRPSRGGEV